MPRTIRVLDRGEEALLERLRCEVASIDVLQRRMALHRRWRNLLIVKARTAGFSGRELEPDAGISNVEISRIYRRSEPGKEAD